MDFAQFIPSPDRFSNRTYSRSKGDSYVSGSWTYNNMSSAYNRMINGRHPVRPPSASDAPYMLTASMPMRKALETMDNPAASLCKMQTNLIPIDSLAHVLPGWYTVAVSILEKRAACPSSATLRNIAPVERIKCFCCVEKHGNRRYLWI